MSDTIAATPQNLAAKTDYQSPIAEAYGELAAQIDYLDETIANIGHKLEPVRNIYPAVTGDPADEPTPPKSSHRQIIEAATIRVRAARMQLETYNTELEV